MPAHATKKPLNREERQLLVVALRELQARNIPLPDEAKVQQRQNITWPLAPNGYFQKVNGALYIPSENQAGFIHSQARFVMFYGSRGSGKSGAGAQKALRKIKDGWDGAIMNPDFENFRYSTWPEFKNWIPWDMVVPSQRHRRRDDWLPTQPFTMVFLNGAKVYCKGLKNPDSARGPNINWLWYDEAGRDETGMGWKIAIASVRVGENPQAWVTETPKPLDHWSYVFFVEQNIPQEALDAFASLGDSGKILIEKFHGTIEENKSNLDPAFYASILASYPAGWLRTQEVLGEFSNEGGKIGDSTWFLDKVLSEPPDGITKKIRFWDMAATEKKSAKDDPDEAVGTLGSKFVPSEEFCKAHNIEPTATPQFCLEEQTGGYWNWDKLVEVIANVARRDGADVEVGIEEEPGSGGKNQVAAVQEYFKRFDDLRNHRVVGVRARDVGDRVEAANSTWFGTAAEGRMWIVKGGWNQKFFAQLDGFTQSIHDDRVTSVTGLMYKLNPFRTWKKVPFVGITIPKPPENNLTNVSPTSITI